MKTEQPPLPRDQPKARSLKAHLPRNRTSRRRGPRTQRLPKATTQPRPSEAKPPKRALPAPGTSRRPPTRAFPAAGTSRRRSPSKRASPAARTSRRRGPSKRAFSAAGTSRRRGPRTQSLKKATTQPRASEEKPPKRASPAMGPAEGGVPERIVRIILKEEQRESRLEASRARPQGPKPYSRTASAPRTQLCEAYSCDSLKSKPKVRRLTERIGGI